MVRFSVDNIHIPNRFESLLESPFLRFEPLIVPVESDLRTLYHIRDKVRVQQSGILVFLLGETGIGKTTAIYSLAVHLHDEFNPIFLVPSTIDIREASDWISANLPIRNDKSLLVLFDGREITDDTVGLRQFFASLNQILRRRPDTLFIWPTTDPDWHTSLRGLAEKIGGHGLAPKESDVRVIGPSKAEWSTVLERILIQYDFTAEDVALEASTIESAVDNANTIGAFLESIGGVIAERTTRKREIQSLPSIVFAISSGSEVAGEANRIRRAGSHILKAEELLAYSPKSEAGKWWKARSSNPQHHLAYIISLFDSRLTTLTPSAVAYACLHHGPVDIQQIIKERGLTRHTINAATTLKRTDLYRFLAGEESGELTSSKKGKTKEASSNAYKAIQALSLKRHKVINQAICQHIGENLGGFSINNARFEVDAGDQNLFTDCIVPISGQSYYLEFHYISPDQCKASRMASYIMDKLRKYAIHYNLIPR